MQQEVTHFPLRAEARLWHIATEDRTQPAQKGL